MLPPRPLPILDISQPEWKLDTKAFDSVLNQVGDRPIAIYSINGSTRSGKSFLLNYFIRYFESQTGNEDEENLGELFDWRSGLQRVTVGINLWSRPYFVQTDEGEVAVLLMDTQGLFDKNTTYRQNAIIFTFSCLFSSVMMFNQKGIITEDVLLTIERFSKFSGNIVYQRNNLIDAQSKFNIGASSKLLFLLRDFELPDYDYGLHNALEKPVESDRNFFLDMFDGNIEGVEVEIPEENRQIRESLQDMFHKVAAYLLPHPGNAFVRQRGSAIKPNVEFQEQAEFFVHSVMSKEHLVKKSIRGEPVTGKQFKYSVVRLNAVCQNLDAYFSDVKSMKEYDDDTQCMKATKNASESYEGELRRFIAANSAGAFEKELVNAHDIALQRAMELFTSMSPNCEAHLKERYRNQVEQKIMSWFLQAEHINRRNINKTRKKKIIKRAAIGAGVTLVAIGVAAGITAAVVLTGPVGVGVAGAIVATKMSVAAAGTAGASAAVVGATGVSAAATGAVVGSVGATVGGAAVVGATVAGASTKDSCATEKIHLTEQ